MSIAAQVSSSSLHSRIHEVRVFVIFSVTMISGTDNNEILLEYVTSINGIVNGKKIDFLIFTGESSL